jgi:hypothetical protein
MERLTIAERAACWNVGRWSSIMRFIYRGDGQCGFGPASIAWRRLWQQRLGGFAGVAGGFGQVGGFGGRLGKTSLYGRRARSSGYMGLCRRPRSFATSIRTYGLGDSVPTAGGTFDARIDRFRSTLLAALQREPIAETAIKIASTIQVQNGLPIQLVSDRCSTTSTCSISWRRCGSDRFAGTLRGRPVAPRQPDEEPTGGVGRSTTIARRITRAVARPTESRPRQGAIGRCRGLPEDGSKSPRGEEEKLAQRRRTGDGAQRRPLAVENRSQQLPGEAFRRMSSG